MSPPTVRRVSRHALVPLSLMVVAFMIAATALSPFLLQSFVADAAEWERLSHIGETYGAASAVLSAFAFIIIGASLMVQIRESRNSQELAERAHHLSLMKLHFEHPHLLSAHQRPESVDSQRDIYHNLLVSYWEGLFEVGRMPAESLSVYATNDLFITESGRRFWQRSRDYRLAVPKSRRTARFVAIVDAAWEASMAEAAREHTTPVPPQRPASPLKGAALSAAFAGGLWWAIRTYRRRVEA